MFKLIKPRFYSKDGNTFHFHMTNHLNPEYERDHILVEICQTILEAYSQVFPMFARLHGEEDECREFPVFPGHKLFLFLDEESRDPKRFNFLIFRIKRREESFDIMITHFGPFGEAKTEELIMKIFVDTTHALDKLREKWNAVQSKETKMTEQEKQEEEAKIKDDLLKNYWSKLNCQLQIKPKLEELKNVVDRVHSNPEDKEIAEKLKVKLEAAARKVIIKAADLAILSKIVREIAVKSAKKAGVKAVAKAAEKAGGNAASKAVGKVAGEAAGKAAEKAAGSAVGNAARKAAEKIAGKLAGEVATKAVPFVGAAVGVGFGVWRCLQGDFVGAGMEIASGAASCFPGTGTTLSLAIDAALVGKDMYEAKAEVDQHFKVSSRSNYNE